MTAYWTAANMQYNGLVPTHERTVHWTAASTQEDYARDWIQATRRLHRTGNNTPLDRILDCSQHTLYLSKLSAVLIATIPLCLQYQQSVLLHLNTTSIYNHKYISFGYMFRYISTIFRPLFNIWRYIQCAHTLRDPIMFWYIKFAQTLWYPMTFWYIQCGQTLCDPMTFWYIQCGQTLWDPMTFWYIQCGQTLWDPITFLHQCAHTLWIPWYFGTFSVHIHYDIPWRFGTFNVDKHYGIPWRFIYIQCAHTLRIPWCFGTSSVHIHYDIPWRFGTFTVHKYYGIPWRFVTFSVHIHYGSHDVLVHPVCTYFTGTYDILVIQSAHILWDPIVFP